MIADEPNERLTLVDPICTILILSPSEVERIKKVANYEANAGVLSGVVNFFLRIPQQSRNDSTE